MPKLDPARNNVIDRLQAGLDNLKLKSPDNLTFARAQFHDFGRD
jgi:hypothetical protein